MLKFAADANFNWRILRGIVRSLPEFDLITAQEAGLDAASDDEVLAWAATEGRVLLTHDARTMPSHAARRIEEGLPMPGLILVTRIAIGDAIQQLCVIAVAGDPKDLVDRVEFL